MESYFKFRIHDGVRAYPPNTHYHEDYEVYHLTEGKCRYFIGSKTYSMNPGDLVLIPPGVIHKVQYETPTHSRHLINCTVDYLPPSAREHLAGISYFPTAPDTVGLFSSLFSRLREADSDRDVFYTDTVRCLGMELFLLLARSAATIPDIGSSSFVENAIYYIQSRYTDRVTLTETASHCAVSPEHLSRVFKKETGFGFNEYLNLYRLKKAEAMLKKGTKKTVAQVALACGFSDSNYFSAAYKKLHGISPSQVKKRAFPQENP